MLHAALANVANPKQLPELSQLLLASRQQSEGHSAATMTHILSQQQPAELESWLNAADVVSNVLRSARQHYSLAREKFTAGDPNISQQACNSSAHAHAPHRGVAAGPVQCAT